MSRNRIRKRLHELKDENLNEKQWLDYMDDIASALGWFIVSFNDLEFEMTDSICELSSLGTKHNTDITFALISSKSFSQKIKDFEMLLRLIVRNKTTEELEKRITQIIKDIEALNSERNAMVHANWYFTEKEGEDTLINTKTGMDKAGFYHEYFKCSPEHIEDLEDKCDEVVNEIESLVNELKKIGHKNTSQ